MNAARRDAFGPHGCQGLLLRAIWLCTLAAICPAAGLAADDPGKKAWKPGRKVDTGRRVYRGQSPGYDSEYAITGGRPASSQYTPSNAGPANYGASPAYGAQPGAFGQVNDSGQSSNSGQSGDSGQMPLRRTSPDSSAGYQGGSSRYPTAGYGPGSTPATPAQYSPAAPPGMYPGSGGGGYGSSPGMLGGGAPPAYGQGPANGTAAGGSGTFQPSNPFSPNASPPPQGSLGPQGPPPNLVPPGMGPGVPPGGLPPGNGQPGMPGYFDQGDIFGAPDGDLPVPITPVVTETQTGRLNFGVGVNSNAGLIGNVVIDEQNFDWKRVPTSWDEVRNGTAFRGGGQQFRISAMPGTQFSQYGFTFRNPYLWDTRINFSLDGFYFNRYYQNWTEQRLGGRVGFGYQLTPDLSTQIGLRAEDVGIFNPTVPTPPELSDVLGHNALYSVSWTTVHDTRDSPFLPTQGHRVSLELEQAWGTFSFPRAIAALRQHFKVYERPDGSGRQVINLLSDVGFTGSHTPIFENFFAGGYNTIRGFYFRGASPLDMGVQVGGKFEFINTVEYMFPLTAGDALRGVVFTDFGTVEQSTELRWNDFRIAPGAGLRVTIPAMGPAPIALDFAVPVHHAPGDQIQIFNFFVGLQR